MHLCGRIKKLFAKALDQKNVGNLQLSTNKVDATPTQTSSSDALKCASEEINCT